MLGVLVYTRTNWWHSRESIRHVDNRSNVNAFYNYPAGTHKTRKAKKTSR